MWRLNSIEEQQATIQWGRNYISTQGSINVSRANPSILRSAFDEDLKNYFAFAALSRSKTAPKELVEEALQEKDAFKYALEHALNTTVPSKPRTIKSQVTADDQITGRLLLHATFRGQCSHSPNASRAQRSQPNPTTGGCKSLNPRLQGQEGGTVPQHASNPPLVATCSPPHRPPTQHS